MKKVIVQMLLMAWLPMVAFAISVEKYVAFTLHYSNPDRDHKGVHRAPPFPINVIKNGYLLLFDNCNGCMVYIMDEEEKVIHVAFIDETGQVEIPSDIEGVVLVRLVKGNVTYQANVEF